MIDFTPTDEQKMLVEAVHRYAETDVRKVAHEADESGEMPPAVISKGWELGLLPGLIPEEYGGYSDGQDAVTGVLALEELAWGDLAATLELWTPALFALPVLFSGTEEQKQEYLPRFCDADRPIMTAALVEPRIAFDPWRPETTASPGDGTFTLNGEKAYVPLAADAEAILVYARNTETGSVDGYIVPRDANGLTIGEREKLMGVRALPTYRVTLSNVQVDATARLGGEEGTRYATILNRSRVALGALATGVARASMEYARDYTKERVQFGVPIATKQAVAFRIARMATEVDALRVLTWEAAWQADQGCDITRDATLVKAYATKAAMFVADSGVQVLGGYGYIREYPAERWLRNARGFHAFDGLAIV
ncbi:MAG TPA: acyl-CoA dehydrogenase family protein [Aggregatilineales bacterium]|nr:acyl-CoA dehydrogenase family protein [Aggregatilineales bacterium]HPV07198.1 acyl-CoA dehydrogenase family protein [Aggregatilineales bacterium]HQA68102.1 acyl-CoA dehydrogenase family protein [Aggregatilineales bacterium]HQE19962.1 acyl-CoA dehydrogenase family protein [Aggregatilineales bacterium]